MRIKTFCGGYDNNFTYVVVFGKECVVIDPAVSSEEVLDWIAGEELELKYVVLLHSHFDHRVDIDKYGVEVYAHENFPGDFEFVKDGDTLPFGFKVIFTPGHTMDAMCLLIDGHLFTSDTLFVSGCGRVDLPGSDKEKMFESLQRLKELDDSIVVYPGHDYGEMPTSTIGIEKKRNRFLLMNWEEFNENR